MKCQWLQIYWWSALWTKYQNQKITLAHGLIISKINSLYISKGLVCEDQCNIQFYRLASNMIWHRKNSCHKYYSYMYLKWMKEDLYHAEFTIVVITLQINYNKTCFGKSRSGFSKKFAVFLVLLVLIFSVWQIQQTEVKNRISGTLAF